jgi:hypothetical protein
MTKLLFSAVIGFVSGIISFFLSIAFLCFVLLIMRTVTHVPPDMSLTYKAAVPVAILAAFTGFAISLVRAMRQSRLG